MADNRSTLIAFDLDGTLVDSSRDIHAALAYALAEIPDGKQSAAADEAALHVDCHGQPLEPFFLMARPHAGEDAMPRFIKAYRAHYHTHLLDYTRPFPGVEEGLRALAALREEVAARRGSAGRALHLGVATTKLTRTARRVVDELGLGGHFDCVLGSDGLKAKPDPAVLFALFSQLGSTARSARSLMVGDTDYDVLAGRAAGLRTCAVGWTLIARERITAASPDHHVTEFAEVVELVREAVRAAD